MAVVPAMIRYLCALAALLVIVSAPSSIRADAIPAGSEFQVNTYTVSDQYFDDSSSVSSDAEGDFVVVWSNYRVPPVATGVFAQRFSSAGVAQGTEFQVNVSTISGKPQPAVSVDGEGDFVMVWSNFQYGQRIVVGRRYDSAGAPQGTEFTVGGSVSYAEAPDVSSDGDGDFVVVWDAGDFFYPDVFGRRYSSAGVVQGAVFQVNTNTTGASARPSVSVDIDGDFVVVWDKFILSAGNGILGQRFSSTGMPQGTEFQVNTHTGCAKAGAAVSTDIDGDFVVVWTSTPYAGSQDGSRGGVFGQRYSSAGSVQGTEFQINSYTPSDQGSPAVSASSNGDFVVVWTSEFQDGSLYDVFARRFNSAGAAQGAELKVNTSTFGFQTTRASSGLLSGLFLGQGARSVSTDADGDFVVTWHVVDGQGIFARRYQLCGNGGVGDIEQCDDGNDLGGDCCSATCQFESPGSACADDGLFCTGTEECDGAGSCLSGGDPCPGTACNTCQEAADNCFDASSIACPDEGNPCTQDACNGSGTCAHDAVPANDCRSAQKSILLLKDDADDDTKDKLIWKWIKGDPTSQTELGDPTTSADYALCVYDVNGILAKAEVPASGTKWSEISDKGYKYLDPGGSEDGIVKAVLKGSIENKSKALVKGAGGNLPDPTLGTLPLPITAQLRNQQTGVCMEGVYDSGDVIKNEAGQFKAKAQQ